MIKSKGWNWTIVKNEVEEYWKTPSVESYYLMHRWKSQEKNKFLDLGCGLGRHTILFGLNGFDVSAFDISKDAVEKTKKWAEEEKLTINYKIGDMLNLPYENKEFDCIYCKNVISHTDTEGMKIIIKELKRVLKPKGECYITLGSKDTWGFKQETWPLVDPNTRLKMEEGPEYKTPHFYVDYKLIKELFKDFNIINIHQEIEYNENNNNLYESYHYHVLIQKGE